MSADDDAVLPTARLVVAMGERGDGVGELRRERLDVGGTGERQVGLQRERHQPTPGAPSAAACMRQTSRTTALAVATRCSAAKRSPTWSAVCGLRLHHRRVDDERAGDGTNDALGAAAPASLFDQLHEAGPLERPDVVVDLLPRVSPSTSANCVADDGSCSACSTRLAHGRQRQVDTLGILDQGEWSFVSPGADVDQARFDKSDCQMGWVTAPERPGENAKLPSCGSSPRRATSTMASRRWSWRSPAPTPTASRRSTVAGLTIDLGFAHTTVADDAGPEAIAFVDVPGHVRFLRNMLAGVGGVDACLFVVAATEGWKPQSEEHLRILELVGVRHGVIALTKVDVLDDPDLVELAVLEVAERVAGSFLADAPIVPVAAPSGVGLDQLGRRAGAAWHAARRRLPIANDRACGSTASSRRAAAGRWSPAR